MLRPVTRTLVSRGEARAVEQAFILRNPTSPRPERHQPKAAVLPAGGTMG
jgi:hypothetical protein